MVWEVPSKAKDLEDLPDMDTMTWIQIIITYPCFSEKKAKLMDQILWFTMEYHQLYPKSLKMASLVPKCRIFFYPKMMINHQIVGVPQFSDPWVRIVPGIPGTSSLS